MISYKKLANSWHKFFLNIAFAFDHLGKWSIYTIKCLKPPGRLQRYFITSLGIGMLCKFGVIFLKIFLAVNSFDSIWYIPLHPQPCYASKIIQQVFGNLIRVHGELLKPCFQVVSWSLMYVMYYDSLFIVDECHHFLLFISKFSQNFLKLDFFPLTFNLSLG